MDMLIDETLRKYPPAYIGPRRSIDAFEFQGMPVPARAHVQYCSWASHHLPDVWPDPDRFDPHRFTPERKAALPKGAYVPFGGGSRTCIGMRFGQAEIAAITRADPRARPARARPRLRAQHPPRADDLTARRPAGDGPPSSAGGAARRPQPAGCARTYFEAASTVTEHRSCRRRRAARHRTTARRTGSCPCAPSTTS